MSRYLRSSLYSAARRAPPGAWDVLRGFAIGFTAMMLFLIVFFGLAEYFRGPREIYVVSPTPPAVLEGSWQKEWAPSPQSR